VTETQRRRANIAWDALHVMWENPGTFTAMEMAAILGCSTGHARRALYALLIIDLVYRGPRKREGYVWSLTPKGESAVLP
jgi:predicted transcriptional regulator